MPFYTYSGSWRQIKKAWVYASNAWQPIKKGWVWVSNEWKLFFSGENVPQIESQVTISQSTNSTNGLVTLTGRNFHWTDALSLTYYFEWSSDGGSVWTQLSTGSINNPSSGTFNEVTHIVQVNQTSPAIDNLYRFRVYAVNITLNNSSTSTSTTISTPRNIVWAVTPITSITYNSATLNFSGGLYSNSYRVRIVNTSDNTTTYQTISGSPGTITGLTQSKNYTVYITGYTGSSANGYPGNESDGQSFSTPAAPTPIQVTAPTAPVGNGLAFTPMASGSSGTYNNIVGSPTKTLITLISTTTPTNGSTTAQGTVRSELYEVTQDDADLLGGSRLSFYTRDAVTGLNGTVYYYYSTAVIAFIGTVTDNFNRSVASGLGTSSSSYIYSSYSNLSSSWSVNGSTAINNTTVALGASATSHPLQTLEVNNPNRTYKISIPGGTSGGIGVAYWVTAAGSWWATYPFYSSATSTTYSCNTPVTTISYSCYTPVSSISYTCNTPQQVTTYSCGGSATTSFCPDNFTTEYNASTVGRRCSGCTTNTSNSYTCGPIQNVSSDPGTVIACNTPSDNGKPCYKFFVGEFGILWQVRYCSVTTSTSYSYNTVSSSTSTTCSGGPISTDASGTGCGGCSVSSSTVTSCSGGPISTDASGTGCGGCGVSSSSSVSCTGGPISTDASGTGCGGCGVSSSTTTSYFTYLNIASNGSLVQTQLITSNTFSGVYSSAGYSRIFSHSSTINNNTITAKAFNSSGVQIGSDFVFTATNPTKTGVLGDTSAGVIKARSADLVGNSYDDLLIQ
jgi:hypothetical protein